MLWAIPLDAGSETYSSEPNTLPWSEFMTEGVEGLLRACGDLLGPHGVREPPGHHVAAEPVDDGGEIHALPSDLDIGDVRRPYLVGEQDALALQEIWEPPRLPGGSREGRERTARTDAHEPHQPGHPVAGGMCLPLLLQHLRYLPCAIGGAADMHAVDQRGKPLVLAAPALPVLRGPACRSPGDVTACRGPAHVQELAGPLPSDPFRKLTCGCLAPPGRIRCRRKTAGGSRARW